MCYSFRNLFNMCYAMNEEEQENEENKVCLQCFHEMMDKWVLLFCFICCLALVIDITSWHIAYFF